MIEDDRDDHDDYGLKAKLHVAEGRAPSVFAARTMMLTKQ